MHDRGASGKVRTQAHTLSIGDAHAGGNDIVDEARELVERNDGDAGTLQCNAAGRKFICGDGAGGSPRDVGQNAEQPVEVDGVGCGQQV